MKQKIIDFFNDIVREMKKVTWPSKDELKESTNIVIVTCLIFAVVTFAVDKLITLVFTGIF